MDFTKQNTETQIAIIVDGFKSSDLKYFMDSDYIGYIEEDKLEYLTTAELKDTINHYWQEFLKDTRLLNLKER